MFALYILAFVSLSYLMYQIRIGNIDWNNPTPTEQEGFALLSIVFCFLSYYAFRQRALHLSERRNTKYSSNCRYNKVDNCHDQMACQVYEPLIAKHNGNHTADCSEQNPSDIRKKLTHFITPLSFFKRIISRLRCRKQPNANRTSHIAD